MSEDKILKQLESIESSMKEFQTEILTQLKGVDTRLGWLEAKSDDILNKLDILAVEKVGDIWTLLSKINKDKFDQ